MLEQKPEIQKEMQDLEDTLKMYKEAYPDNPAFAPKKLKKKLEKAA